MAAKSVTTAASPKPRKAKTAPRTKAALARKRYVLDTNVLLHDPTAIFRFEEHDVVLPMVVLEELDRHKKGVADIARNARQVTRLLDGLLCEGSLAEGFDLAKVSSGVATGRLYFRDADDGAGGDGPRSLEQEKADNLILACAMALLKQDETAVLVTKDINLRVKALACDVPAQDYRNDRVFTDEDVLPSGVLRVDGDFWEEQGAIGEEAFWRKGDKQFALIRGTLPLNSFVLEEMARGRTRLWRVMDRNNQGTVLCVVPHQAEVDGAPLLSARNDEQVMALNLLHDDNVDVVALLGPAGCGKTLLAVASGLEQVRRGLYREVMITRATVPLGEDIGFLPGTEQEKMGAWLGGTLKDVFSVLNLNDEKSPVRQKVEIASMTFMRGRSFQGKFIVVDEAQNLTPKQMQALLTRAGEGSKVVLTGNLAQIDSPYLDEGSSGLAWAVKNLQDWRHSGNLIMTRGERSRLATYVEDVAGKGSDRS